MKYALMFNVLKDGEIEPIKWSKDIFMADRSIILLEELTPAVWLWHGVKQSLVDRRIASRQAEALKGYGYKARDTIIGSRTRIIKEIDQRKVGKDAETDEFYREFREILNKEFNPIDDIIVALQLDESEIELELKPKIGPETIPEQESESVSESIVEKIPEKTQKPVVKATFSETAKKAEIKPSIAKIKRVTKPSKPIKKPEFAFESQVMEVGSYNTTEIIKSVLERIEKMEVKLDTLIKEFKEFKSSFQKE